jgi:hypothetical protein
MQHLITKGVNTYVNNLFLFFIFHECSDISKKLFFVFVIMGYCDVIMGYCDVIMGYCDVIVGYCDVIMGYCV